MFRDAASVLGLPGGLIADGVGMASELAASTLRGPRKVQFDDAGDWPLVGAPELWIYLRRAGGRWELVCKVFDSPSGWKDGPPVPGQGADEARCAGRGCGSWPGCPAGGGAIT